MTSTYNFMVLVSGAVEVIANSGQEEQIVVQHGPGPLLGELNMLLRSPRLRVGHRGRVRRGPRDPALNGLRRLIATDPDLGDTILAAFVAGRSVLMTGASASTRLIGSRDCPLCLQVREFLARSRIPYEWLDPDSDPQVDGILLERFGIDRRVSSRSSSPRGPGPAPAHARASWPSYLGLTVESLPGRCFDLVVVGGGPAGLAAAVYAASEGLSVLVLSTRARWAARRARRRGSRTILASRRAFPGKPWPGEPSSRAQKFGAAVAIPGGAVSPRVSEPDRRRHRHAAIELTSGSVVRGP